MITAPVLIDTGPLVSIIRSSQQHHDLCCQALRQITPPLLTVWPALTEAAYLLRRRPNEVRQLLDACCHGFLKIEYLGDGDIEPINAILRQYEDQAFQLADAALMHISERQSIDHVFTLDRKDFGVFHKSSGQALTIIPE